MTNDPPQTNEWRFPVGVAVAMSLLIVAYRIGGGAGFGFLPAEPSAAPLPLGIVHNEHDNLMYLSWTRQAAEGAWLFEDRYALEEHPAVFFNPYFLLLGKVAALLQLPPLGLFILSGLLAAPVVVVASYWIARRVGLTVSAARAATVLVAFSSGVTYPLQWLWALGGGTFPEALHGADARYADALFFPTFLVHPYISVAYAVMCLAILVILRCDDRRAQPRGPWLLLLGALTLLLGFTHPYEHVMLFVGFGGLTLWSRRWDRVPIVLTMGLASGVVVVYFLWLASQPVWDYVAQVSAKVPFDPVIWITGWGVLLPLAFFGSAATARSADLERARWFVVWLAALVVLLIGLNVPQTKVCAGGHLPLCLLSAVALADVHQRLNTLRGAGLIFARGGVALLWASLFGSSLGFALARLGHDARIDGSLLAVMGAVPPRSRVVCDYRVADVLVPLTGVRTFCGNHYKTPDWPKKRDRQALAGTDPDLSADVVAPAVRRRMLAELLAEQRIDYLLLQHNVPAYTDISLVPGVTHVATRGEWSLYRVTPSQRGAGDSE